MEEEIMDGARLIIPVRSERQLDAIFETERKLNEAGVTFDSGSDIEDGRAINRIWELGYSLSGAEIKIMTDSAKQLGAKIPNGLMQSIFGKDTERFEDATLSPKSKNVFDEILGRRH